MGFQHKEQYRQCSAKSKRSQQRCKNAAMRNRAVCRMHGGKSIRGTETSTYQHGYYSKDIYPRLAWGIIKGIWRDGIQTMRLVRAMQHAPSTSGVKVWDKHRLYCLHEMGKPIPDIPKEHHSTLWQAWEQGQSQGVKDAVRLILLSE